MYKPYVMTEADIQLIANFAGALNTGRAMVPPADRFGNIGIPAVAGSPSIKSSHADEFQELVMRAQQPAEPPSNISYFDGPKEGKSRVEDIVFKPAMIHAMKGNGVHRVSAGASGSPKLWSSLNPAFPNPSQLTGYGAGITNPELITPAGDWVAYFKLDESMTSEYTANVDVLSV